MIPPYLLPLTVTWIEPGTTTDRYGNTIPAWDAGTDTEIAAWIEQQQRIEDRDGRDTLVSGWLLVTNELDITAGARIVWDGRTYEVDGEPAKPMTPAGVHHLEVRLQLVEG